MNALTLFLTLLQGAKKLIDKLRQVPVVWTATFNGQPVSLGSIAVKLAKPRSRYIVYWTNSDGVTRRLEALHDFDGKPADTLTLNYAALPDGDMDVLLVLKSELRLRLQWEWEGNRLRLETDLTKNLLGQKILTLD